MPEFGCTTAGSDRRVFDADDSRLQDLGYPSSRGSWYIKDQQDPVAVFTIPSDGDYILGIEDSEGGAGPDHVYRIEIEPVRNEIYTFVTSPDGYQMPRLNGFIVPQGGRWTLEVQLAQGLGNEYKGEIELEAKGLPRGVTMIAPKFGKGVTRLPVQFVAAPDAEPQAALIELLARPVDKAAQLDSGSRQGFALTNRSGELPWHFVWLDKFAFAVTQPAPFEIELEPPAIPLVQGGDLTLNAKVIRHGDFTGPVEIVADWLPPGVSKGAVVTIPGGQGRRRVSDSSQRQGREGGRTRSRSTLPPPAAIPIAAWAASASRRKFADLKVMEPYLTLDIQHSSVEQGKQAQITAIIHQNQPFEGKAVARLQQLPKGVKMLDPAPEITSKDTQVTFRIAADKDALAGLNKGSHLRTDIQRSRANVQDAQRLGRAARG